MKKKMYGLLFALLLVMLLIPASVFADTSGDFAGGDGSAANPYQITTKQHLYNVRNYPDSNFILMNDIMFEDKDFKSGGDFYNDNKGWKIVETLNGTFDGNNHTIYNLQHTYIAYSEEGICRDEYVGLFAENLNGTIENLSFKNVIVKGMAHGSEMANGYDGSVGLICNKNKGAVKNCYISGNIDELYSCSFGGICVTNYGEIESCVSNIQKTELTSNLSGGYAGFCYRNRENGVVSNCLNLSNFTFWENKEDLICGNSFVGINYGRINSCVNLGTNVYCLDTIGKNSLVRSQTNQGSLKNSYNYASRTKNVASYDGVTELSKTQLKDKTKYANLDFSKKWTMNQFTNLPVPAKNEFAKQFTDTDKIFSLVQNLRAESYTYKSVRLSWDRVENAEGYALYRSIGEIGNGHYAKKIATINNGATTEYIDQTASRSKMNYYHIAPIFSLEGEKVQGAVYGWANARVVDTNSSSVYSNDYTGPVIEDVTVVTKNTTTPGAVEVRLSISDENSGVVSATVTLQGGTNISETKEFTATKKKTIVISVPVGSKAKTGTYYLGRITIKDKAGNATECIGQLIDRSAIKVVKEFDIEFKGVLSNGNVARELKNMDAGKTVLLTIDEKSNGILKKELLDAIKGQDKTLVVYANDSGSLQWVFYGKDIIGTTKDLDLTVKYEKVGAEMYGGSGSIIQLTYADNGVLPGDINFRIKTDYIQSINGLDDDLYLYYLKGKKVNLESSSCKVLKDGSTYWCYLDLDHNSKFLLSGKKLKHPISKQSAVLSYTTATYSGAAKKPKVTIKGLTKGEDYTVSYKNNVNAGKAIVTIKGTGNYAGTLKKTFTIKPKKITIATLGTKTYIYNGEVKKPSVTVKAGDKTVLKAKKKDSTSIDLTYAKGRKKPGTYKVTNKGKGNYTGTITKTFKIKVKQTSVTELAKGKKSFTVKWKKASSSNITGYQIRYSTSKKFSKYKSVKVTKNTTTSKKIKNLKGNKKYWVKVRTYKKIGDKIYYSAWSESKAVTTKR